MTKLLHPNWSRVVQLIFNCTSCSAINQKGEQPANEIDIFKMAVYSAIERFRFFNDL